MALTILVTVLGLSCAMHHTWYLVLETVYVWLAYLSVSLIMLLSIQPIVSLQPILFATGA